MELREACREWHIPFLFRAESAERWPDDMDLRRRVINRVWNEGNASKIRLLVCSVIEYGTEEEFKIILNRDGEKKIRNIWHELGLIEKPEEFRSKLRVYLQFGQPKPRMVDSVDNLWKLSRHLTVALEVLIENGLDLAKQRFPPRMWDWFGNLDFYPKLVQLGLPPNRIPARFLVDLGPDFSELGCDPYRIPLTAVRRVVGQLGLDPMTEAVVVGDLTLLNLELRSGIPNHKHLIQAGIRGHRDVAVSLVTALGYSTYDQYKSAFLVVVDPTSTVADLAPFKLRKAWKLRKLAVTLGREDLLPEFPK
jgi:hypothetical protein